MKVNSLNPYKTTFPSISDTTSESCAGLIAGKFRANGEKCVSDLTLSHGPLADAVGRGLSSCCAPNRILVQSGIHDKFVEALAAKMSSFKTGPGTAKDTTHGPSFLAPSGSPCSTLIKIYYPGPLIHQVQRDRCAAFVDDMVSKGAKVVLGGKIPDHLPAAGAFYEPTLVTGVTKEMNSWRGEIFGPVAPLTKFETEKEALDLANDCEMGEFPFCQREISLRY